MLNITKTLTCHVFACQELVQHTWFKDFASCFVFSCMFLFSKVSTDSSPEDLYASHFKFVFFKESRLSFKVKGWIYNCVELLALPSNSLCKWKLQLRLLYSSQVKKYDTWLLIQRITFLTCEKSNMGQLIGFHQFGNENPHFAAFQGVNLSTYIIKWYMVDWGSWPEITMGC